MTLPTAPAPAPNLRLSTLRREHAQAIQEGKTPVQSNESPQNAKLGSADPYLPDVIAGQLSGFLDGSTTHDIIEPMSAELQEDGTQDLDWHFPARPLDFDVVTLDRFIDQANVRGADGSLLQSTPKETPYESKPARKGALVANTKEQDTCESSPWTGSHAEDILSDQSIKHGYSIKSQLVTETHTARATLWPHLKAKGGLQNLSALFGALLQHRCAEGKIAASSGFKPPPRVTLTDQKREAWLRDLANPAVPLRKQSRTIPHGVKGKILLEQCLLKRLPMTRAVWLAKCVGANELRAFRRKGISTSTIQENEIRWIRDWTVSVEAFVDEHIENNAGPSWKKHLQYVLHLNSRLFTEGLLDADHYIDWVLRKLSECNLEQLPVALLLAQNHQTTFTSSASLGQRLTRCCLQRLGDILATGDRFYAPLYDRMEELLQIIMACAPDCCIIGDNWSTVRPLFTAIRKMTSARLGHRSVAEKKESIIQRNDRLYRLAVENLATLQIPSLKLVAILDALRREVVIPDLAESCRKDVSDPVELTTVLLRWATSKHRAGIHRTYLVCRLLYFWQGEPSMDIESCVFNAINRLQGCTSTCSKTLARLVAELVRSGHLQASRYLNAILTAGGLGKDSKQNAHILAQLPMQNTPQRLGSLPSMMLRSSNSSISRPMPGEDLSPLKRQIQHYANQALQGRGESLEGLDLLKDLDVRPAHQIFDLSAWLVAGLSLLLSPLSPHSDPVLGVRQVKSIVALLDAMNDYFRLHPIFLAIGARSDMDGLLQLSYAVETRSRALCCLGAFTHIWRALYKRYRELRVTHPPHKGVSSSLLNTASCMEPDDAVVQYLKQDVMYSEANQAVAASTPMSDGQFEGSQDFGGDLDRILAAGSVLETSQLSAAIGMLLSRVSDDNKLDEIQVSTITTTLMTLKVANEATFQTCLLSWLHSHLSRCGEAAFFAITSMIFGAECLTLSEFVGFIKDQGTEQPSPENTEKNWTLAFKTLCYFFAEQQILLENPHSETSRSSSTNPVESDTRAMFRQHFCRDHMQDLLRWTALLVQDRGDSMSHENIKVLLRTSAYMDAVRQAILLHPDEFQAMFVKAISISRVSFENTKELVERIVLPCNPLPALHATVEAEDTQSRAASLSRIFMHVDAVSLPFQQLLLSFSTHPWIGTDDWSVKMAEVCVDCVAAFSGKILPWPQLLDSLDVDVSRQVRILCENMLLNVMSAETPFDDLRVDPSTCAKIIDCTRAKVTDEADPGLGRRIAQQLYLAAQSLEASEIVYSKGLADWLIAVIDVVLINYRSSIMPSSVSHLVTALLNIMATDSLRDQMQLIEPAFDACLFLVPHLTKEQAQAIRGRLGSAANDTRARLVLGFGAEQEPIFHLTSNTTVASPLSTTNSTTTFPLRKWELLPYAGNTDTALCMRLFGARKEQV